LKKLVSEISLKHEAKYSNPVFLRQSSNAPHEEMLRKEGDEPRLFPFLYFDAMWCWKRCCKRMRYISQIPSINGQFSAGLIENREKRKREEKETETEHVTARSTS